MTAITLKNGWKTATVSQWVSSSGTCFVVVLQNRKSRQFKTLAGAMNFAERSVGGVEIEGYGTGIDCDGRVIR